MTISLGFRTSNGVLLCSDRQITVDHSHKYYDLKFREIRGDSWGMVFNFAWSPEMMNLFFEAVQQHFPVDSSAPSPQAAKNGLADIAGELYRQHKDFRVQQILCAVSLPSNVLFLRISGKAVTEATPVEYLGVGDSSLVRYLTALLVSADMTAFRAAKVASYVVTQANLYIDGCSGGPDTRYIGADGIIRDYGSENELEPIQDALVGLVHSGSAYLNYGLKRFEERVRDFYKTEELLSFKPSS